MTTSGEDSGTRLDLGGFGRVVTGLLTGITVLGAGVAALVDVAVWALAALGLAALLLWLWLVTTREAERPTCARRGHRTACP